jgi:hypothetical protein
VLLLSAIASCKKRACPTCPPELPPRTVVVRMSCMDPLPKGLISPDDIGDKLTDQNLLDVVRSYLVLLKYVTAQYAKCHEDLPPA